MNNLPHIDAVQPAEPDPAALGREADQHVSAIAAAADADAIVARLTAWEQRRRQAWTWASWAHLRFSQDSLDPENEARNQRASALGPQLETIEIKVKAAVLDSPLRDRVADRVGAYLLALWEADRASHDEALQSTLTREHELVSRYMASIGRARVDFRGQTVGIPQLRALQEDADRDTRHDAARAFWGWFGDQGDDLDGIYQDLLDLRVELSSVLGDPDHTTTAYRRLRRLGYGPDDVAAFREQIREHVVPLVTQLEQQQAERLGVDRLMAWDRGVLDPAGNPRPQGDPQWQMDQAATLMQRLSPDMGDFYAMMHRRGLLDLVPREGKSVGGFCTFLPDAAAPFVFANMNGTADDARVFTHELGHAWQVWKSRDKPFSDLLWPTMDAAEICSMSLELLSWPQLELFFGDDAPRFRRNHMIRGLGLMPWMAALDDFQHQVYADPSIDRDATWQRVEQDWIPGLDWGDLDVPAGGARWRTIGHFFHTPFYAIDYALAQCCALQLWLLSRRDPDDAWRRYHALAAAGGSASFVDLVDAAGLRSPFEPGALAAVVNEARTVLETELADVDG